MSSRVIRDGLVIGVDVGGTKVAAGVVDSNGEVRAQVRQPMSARGQAADGLTSVLTAIDSLFTQDSGLRNRIHAIGICSPGPLDPHTGIVINPPNLPCWRNFPLATQMSRVYQIPVRVDNDANAAALAEAVWGAGRGYENVLYVTIGTGIGTGIVFHQRIYHGRTGAAGEGGHVSIDYRGPRCGCGKRGCIEVLASGPAIAARTREKIAVAGSKSMIVDLAGGKVVTAEIVGEAYAAGDALAKQILEETTELLSFWLANMVDLLEPDVIIVGGGVATMLQPFFAKMSELVSQNCLNPRGGEIPLVPARYGTNAGIVGGAALSTQDAVLTTKK
jgi:glucokinase